jgi:hypothetical protein
MDVQARYDALVEELLTRYGDVERTQMMDMPSVKRNDELVLGLSRGESAMAFKLTDPVAHGEALKLPGAHLFDPSGQGRPIKGWVVVPAEHAEEWPRFAELALG